MKQITCKHFGKNPKQDGYTYGLSNEEEIIVCRKCNENLRRSMVHQLADEAGVKVMEIYKKGYM